MSIQQFCPNCGKAINEDVNYCPYCRYNISKVFHNKDKMPTRKSDKLPKKIQKAPKLKTKKSNLDNNKEVKSKKQTSSKNEKRYKYIFPTINITIYLLLSLLLLFGASNDQILGVIIYSFIVTVIVFYRRKKDKPINWLATIFLVLQFFFISILSAKIVEFLNYGGDAPEALLLLGIFIFMLIVILLILIRGNKKIL